MLVTCCLREQKYYFRKNIQWAKNIFRLLVTTVGKEDDLGVHHEDVEGGGLSRVLQHARVSVHRHLAQQPATPMCISLFKSKHNQCFVGILCIVK